MHVYSNLLKNNLAVKGCGPMQKGQGEKVVKYMSWPRNGCDGRSVTI